MDALGFGELFQNTHGLLNIFFSWFPVWGALFFGGFFWYQWMHYVQAKYIFAMDWVLLEIKLPKETKKTPLAMEIALNALYQTSEGVWYDKIWKGKQKDWFSLEMVSFEGHVKFFIRTNRVFKNIIEAQLYAQYPEIEIYEVPDYVRYVDYRGKEGEWNMFGIEFGLEKEDAYPIKTYVDYGLDNESVKEEFKTDPLTSVIEYLGSIGKDEQIWIQILVQAPSKRYHYYDEEKKKHEVGDWKKEGQHLIDKLTKRKESSKVQGMTDREKEVIRAVERNIGKLGFDCGIRALYLAKKSTFKGFHTKALGGLLRPFATNDLNSFKGIHQTFGFDFPWQDFKDIRITWDRKRQFDAYKQRSWFYAPHDSPYHFKPFVLTTEELATIYHFPGGVSQTPTFGRIPSKKSEAPVNLPV